MKYVLLPIILFHILFISNSFAWRDLETGAYFTRDPAGFIDGPNMYTYVRQNPWTMIDPLGLLFEEPQKMEMKDEMDEEERQYVEDHNEMVDSYNEAHENSIEFRKMIETLEDSDKEYSLEITSQGTSHVNPSSNTKALVSQRDISAGRGLDATVEELAHLVQNDGVSKLQENQEYKDTLLYKEKAKMLQKAYDGAQLGLYDESDQEKISENSTYSAREAQAARAVNIVKTEVAISTAKPGDEPVYSRDVPMSEVGTHLHRFHENNFLKFKYTDIIENTGNRTRSYIIKKPYGSYKFRKANRIKWHRRQSR